VADTPPADPGAADPPKDGPLKDRVDSIESEQKRQGGVLDEIKQLLAGQQADSGTVVNGDQPPAAAAADMAEQMKQAVRDVQAESDAEVGRQARLGAGRPPAETSPREVMVKGKDRLQRALFGGDPK
jgi:hypothetical protein